MSGTARVVSAAVVALATVVVSCSGSGDPQAPPPTWSPTGATEDDDRPDIVVVMADDMRADDLRFMPQLRRLVAGRGLTFRNAFSPHPLCCPARASFLTGQYPHNHGVLSNLPPWGFPAFDDRATLATALREVGYTTAFVGKYLNQYGVARSPLTGRASLRYVPPGWSDWSATIEPPAGSGITGGTHSYFDTAFTIDGRVDADHAGQYQTRILGRFARRIVRRESHVERPLFLWLSALAPHTGLPRESDDQLRVRAKRGVLVHLATPARPESVRGMFDRRVRRAPGIPVAGGSSEPSVRDKPAFLRQTRLTPAEEAAVLELTRQRAEALHVLDLEVRRLVDTLRRTGALEHTVLVFTSDNGYFLGEHRQRFAKTLPYEPALRVPLLVVGPGVPQRERVDPATTVDLTATILDLAGAEAPHEADGSSLLPWSDARGWTRPVVLGAVVPGPRPTARWGTEPRSVIGVRTARFAFHRWATGAEELYDLRLDPSELVNVARDRRYRDVRLRLLAVWRRVDDCRGATCRAPLPPSLRVPAERLHALTEVQADGVRARFGVSW